MAAQNSLLLVGKDYVNTAFEMQGSLFFVGKQPFSLEISLHCCLLTTVRLASGLYLDLCVIARVSPSSLYKANT